MIKKSMGKRKIVVNEGYKVVRLTNETHAKLKKLGVKDETFEEIIKKLIDSAAKK